MHSEDIDANIKYSVEVMMPLKFEVNPREQTLSRWEINQNLQTKGTK